jgi:Icc-related predicted phosphoesterase
MRIFFATDVHGSDRCFTKFVNAAGFYSVDALILGGDITGKALVPLVAAGNGDYQVRFLGEDSVVGGDALLELEKRVANTGYYPYRCEPEEAGRLREDPSLVAPIFLELMLGRVGRWMQLAEERLAPQGIPCFVNAGNDDPCEVDEVIRDSAYVEFLEGTVVELPDGTELASCGYANKTPWDCPRDLAEDKLEDRLGSVVAKLRDPDHAIVNFHCPPYDSVIDTGPVLGADMRLQSGAAGVLTGPVGSKACRRVIDRVQPMLGLHGHIHESRGTFKLGRTTCINPGSEYTEGILRGALVEVRRQKVKSHQLTAG